MYVLKISRIVFPWSSVGLQSNASENALWKAADLLLNHMDGSLIGWGLRDYPSLNVNTRTRS